jgi:serine/threonine protein kinase
MNKLFNSKYRKIKKIGEGSFGCVYLVEDLEGKSFAMKKFYLDNVKLEINL